MTSRRAVLRGALGLVGAAAVGAVLAACDGPADDPGSDGPSPLLGFLTETAELADQYDAAITAVPALSTALTPVRDAHRAHVKALAAALGTTAPPTAAPTRSPSDSTAAMAALVAAEKAGRDAAVAACLSAAPRLAPLVGSIAAARATHLEVLT